MLIPASEITVGFQSSGVLAEDSSVQNLESSADSEGYVSEALDTSYEGALQGDAETNAVLKQIEKAMTAEQVAAIAAMQLAVEDLGARMQEQGVNLAPPSGAAAARADLPRRMA